MKSNVPKVALPMLLALWVRLAGADSVFSLARITIAYPDKVPTAASVFDSAYSDQRASGQLVLRPNGTYTQSVTVCTAACATNQSNGRLVGSREGRTFTVQDGTTGSLYKYNLISANPLILAVNVSGIVEIYQWVPRSF